MARHEDVMVLGWHHVTHGGKKIPLSYDSTKVAYEPISSEKGEFFLFSGNNADSSWNELYVMKTEWIKHGIPAGRIPRDSAGLSAFDSVLGAKKGFW